MYYIKIRFDISPYSRQILQVLLRQITTKIYLHIATYIFIIHGLIMAVLKKSKSIRSTSSASAVFFAASLFKTLNDFTQTLKVNLPFELSLLKLPT